MADTKISEMTAATSLADADLVPVVQGGVNKRGTVDLILDGITAARVNTALGYTAANDAALNASNLTSGTVPDARFPATLPAASGVNLTNLVATNIATGLVPTARLGGGTASSSTYLRGDQTWATVTAGVDGSGTANQIPTWSDTDTLAGSKMTASGTNSGTWTLYDDTAVTGVTQLAVRAGAGQGSAALLTLASGGGPNSGIGLIASTASNVLTIKTADGGQHANVICARFLSASGSMSVSGEESLLLFGYDVPIIWCSSAIAQLAYADTGLVRNSAGVLRVTNGSTGFGSLRAANLGVETANGAISNIRTVSESITLSTSGLTTDSTADLLPANSIILAVTARVTTAITTTTDWALGDAMTSNRFSAPNTTLAAGTTVVGVRHQQGSVTTDATGPVQTSAGKLRITCTGPNPGAGAVRVTVTYLELTPPTS